MSKSSAVFYGFLLAGGLWLGAHLLSVEMRATSPSTAIEEDAYLWLEEVESPEALDWAQLKSQKALEALSARPLFSSIEKDSLEVLQSQDRLPMPQIAGEWIYNFWTDAKNIRGLWRRSPAQAYNAGTPQWEILLDLDQLAEQEKENWVWGGANGLAPDFERWMISLSRRGADAKVQREFDIKSKSFVNGGFFITESKSSFRWLAPDHAFLGLALTPEQVTNSGYPMQVRLWQRGTDPQQAPILLAGLKSDLSVAGRRLWDGDQTYDLLFQYRDFYNAEVFHFQGPNSALVQLPLPSDAQVQGVFQGQLLIELKSNWTINDQEFEQGSLLAGPLEDLLVGNAQFTKLFSPSPTKSLHSLSLTQSSVVGVILDNVVGRLVSWKYSPVTQDWTQGALRHDRSGGTISVVASSRWSEYFYSLYTDFLTPSSLFVHSKEEPKSILSSPAWFNSDGMKVSQHFVESKDGQKLPYFLVTPQGFEATGNTPTLLSAYGGFQVSWLPFYSGLVGRAWLERGGVYVLANIRGGGEYGPSWHQAALRENRQRAFDDFYAVAEDLIQRGITSPPHLGISGGSNGGLLVGVAITQRPELFGAAISSVPLLDMRRYHLLPPGDSWVAEYGNPDNPKDWAYISQYSPYHNVHPEPSYPKVLFYTSTRDDRVHPAHARKMAAKMTDQGHSLLFYENQEGGHGGSSNSPQRARQQAIQYSFLHQVLSVEKTAEK